jgi:hypothetical protein
MKKASKKQGGQTSAAKVMSRNSGRVRAVKAAAPTRSTKTPLIDKQPQSKQKAAVSAGMFLYTDDAWSLRYFDSKDLHCVERELFG